MRASSAKAKGRRLQQFVRDQLRLLYRHLQPSVEDDDIESRPMGCNGVDIILTPAARKVFDIAVEAKNQESINLCGTFWTHYKKHGGSTALTALIHAKNRTEPTITVRWYDFLPFLLAYTSHPETDWRGMRDSILENAGGV